MRIPLWIQRVSGRFSAMSLARQAAALGPALARRLGHLIDGDAYKRVREAEEVSLGQGAGAENRHANLKNELIKLGRNFSFPFFPGVINCVESKYWFQLIRLL